MQAEQQPHKFTVIDASLSQTQVATLVIQVLDKLIEKQISL
jgi:hypothetical protein